MKDFFNNHVTEVVMQQIRNTATQCLVTHLNYSYCTNLVECLYLKTLEKLILITNFGTADVTGITRNIKAC